MELSAGSTQITRPPIHCFTAVKKIKCQYTWTIKNYMLDFIDAGMNVLLSPTFSATTDTCRWCIKLYHTDHLKCNLFTVEANDITKNGLSTADLKFAIIDSMGQESNAKKKKHKLENNKKFYGVDNEMIGVQDLLQNRSTLLPENNLTIHCEVEFTKRTDVTDDFEEFGTGSVEMNDSSAEDFETLFNSKQFSDIVIHVNGKEFPAHKSILAGRCETFAALLRTDMEETQTNRIDITDIDDDVFMEALRFIYTGKVQNLETLAFELLKVADKYDLKKLKIMCERVLRRKISVETVVKILVLADMHGVENLKKRCLNYVRDYTIDVVSKVDSESWSNLLSRPCLMKELLSEFARL